MVYEVQRVGLWERVEGKEMCERGGGRGFVCLNSVVLQLCKREH